MKRLLFALLLLTATGTAQQYNKVYKGVRANSVLAEDDGSAIVTGDYYPQDRSFIAKLNPNGDTAWITFNDIVPNRIHYGQYGQSIEKATSGYLQAGLYNDTIDANIQIYLSWITKDGSIKRTKTYGKPEVNEWCYMAKKIEPNKIIIAGFRYYKKNSADSHPWILCLDSIGTIQWEQEFEDSLETRIYDLTTTKDKGIVFTGINGHDDPITGSGYFSSLLFKLDSNGSRLWRKVYNRPTNCGTNYMAIDESGNIYLSGNAVPVSIPTKLDAMLMKTDSTGNLLWQKMYPGSFGTSSFNSIQFFNKKIIVAGVDIINSNEDSHGLIKKIEPVTGNIIWQKFYYYNNSYNVSNGFRAMAISPVGEVIAVGSSWDFRKYAPYFTRFWVVKTDSLGNTVAGNPPNVVCTFTLSNTNFRFSAQAGEGDVDCKIESICAWEAYSTASFVNIINSTGTGKATLSYTVSANTGPQRSCQIYINREQPITIIQDSAGYVGI